MEKESSGYSKIVLFSEFRGLGIDVKLNSNKIPDKVVHSPRCCQVLCWQLGLVQAGPAEFQVAINLPS